MKCILKYLAAMIAAVVLQAFCSERSVAAPLASDQV